jgi:tricorn protease-like protein
MNSKFYKILFLFLICFIILFIESCEPISVSVNSEGEVAFSRGEGTFYINLKTKKLTVLNWNYGKETIPVIARWAPKGDQIALTIKDNKDSQNTSIFLIDKKGNSKKIYSGTKVITQVEWSKGGNYLSFAQAGKDTDMQVADIGLISVKDGMSKIILENCGDVHKWLNDSDIAVIKINKKNTKNSEIFSGDLSFYKTSSQQIDILSNVIIAKSGGLDCSLSANQIAFTAITVQENAKEFQENMTSNAFLFLYNLKSKKIEKVSDDIINFVKYSPDNSKILVKAKDKDDNNLINLGFFDVKSKAYKVLVKNTTDKVNVNSTEVQAYPEWFDSNNVLFWRLSNSYGSNRTLQLMKIDLKSNKKENIQILIDTEVHKIVEAKGGY